MKITIFLNKVEIKITGSPVYCMSYQALNQLEKAIKIINYLKCEADAESAIITLKDKKGD